MLIPQVQAGMRGDVIEIRARGNILLIGGAGTLAGIPRTLRQRSAGVSAVQRLDGDTQALHHLRHFWLRRSHSRSIMACSDRDLLSLVATGISHGDLDAVVLPSYHARGRAVTPVLGSAGAPPTRGAAAPGRGRPPPVASPVAPIAVGRMGLEERLAEVLHRAAARFPRAMGDELLSLVTPESVAMALGLAAFGAAANFTPFGWAADVILAAIAFGFGGLAAVQALGDLVTCFQQIADAESERDLDEAADALARAASAITVAGLVAILHEKARRWGGGEESEAPSEGRRTTPSVKQTGGRPREALRNAEDSAPQDRPLAQETWEPAPDAADAVRPPLLPSSRVATEPDIAFFWSGRSVDGAGARHGGAGEAASIAKARGGTTLEALIEERGIKMPDWDPNDVASVNAWADISAEYAGGASGEVRAVIGSDLRPGNIWQATELPSLMTNPKVTRIITIDPATGVSKIIYP